MVVVAIIVVGVVAMDICHCRALALLMVVLHRIHESSQS